MSGCPEHASADPQDRDVLIDVSRLIWRTWAGKLPTGVDRVCLAYLEHFRGRSLAVIQRKSFRRILPARASDRLFQLLSEGPGASAARWAGSALTGLPSLLSQPTVRQGTTYINVGHTGLDEPSLPVWIASRRLRAIFMVHDLIPITHPQYCRAGERDRHAGRMGTVLTSATGIICNSRATAEELSRFAVSCNLPVPPILPALIAGGSLCRTPGAAPASKPYFVVLGTIEGRKNHQLLLRVWDRLLSELGPETPRLVIVGQRGWKADHVLRRLDDLGPLQEFVEERGTCDDNELSRLLLGARALLMPSFTEGFGLPISEALHLSVPVIASNLAVYREMAGGIPIFLDPDDEGGWACAILDFLGDSPDRQRQLAAAATYRRPTWPDHFRQLEGWLDTLSAELRAPAPIDQLAV